MTSPATTAAVLADAAFGGHPGRWPLPGATSACEHWLRAVAAGGQGRYGSALADLTELARKPPSGPWLSLALSTRASFLRQLGGHDRARGWDGRALACAAGDPDATADALIGLAADALGVGRFAASATALDRAAALATESPRLRVRHAWVSAELAMARGLGSTAVRHAEEAVDLARAFGSARHAVKSEVVRSAALCSAGDLRAARGAAEPALEAAGRFGMIPLRWALACLLADIGSAAHSADEVVAIRDESADIVRRRGGMWSVR